MKLCSLLVPILLLVVRSTVPRVDGFTPEFRGDSRFFLSTANEGEWGDLLCTGLFHGVMTNPSLLEEADQACTVPNLRRMAHVALQSVNEFVCPTWGNSAQDLYDTGMALAQGGGESSTSSVLLRDGIVLQLPVTFMGVQAATRLMQAGCRVCLTRCCDHKQALVAVSIGAEYLAPNLACMNSNSDNDDAAATNNNGAAKQECIAMQQMVRGMHGETRILVDNVEHVQDLSQLARAGLETFAFSPAVARDLFVEPLTDKVATLFQEAAQSNQGESSGGGGVGGETIGF